MGLEGPRVDRGPGAVEILPDPHVRIAELERRVAVLEVELMALRRHLAPLGMPE